MIVGHYVEPYYSCQKAFNVTFETYKIALECLSIHIEQSLRRLTICFCGQGIIYDIRFCFGGLMYPMDYIMTVSHNAQTCKLP